MGSTGEVGPFLFAGCRPPTQPAFVSLSVAALLPRLLFFGGLPSIPVSWQPNPRASLRSNDGLPPEGRRAGSRYFRHAPREKLSVFNTQKRYFHPLFGLGYCLSMTYLSFSLFPSRRVCNASVPALVLIGNQTVA